MLLKKFFIIFNVLKSEVTFRPNQSFSPVPPLHLFPEPHRGSAPSKHQSFKGSLPTSVPRRLSKKTNTLNTNRCAKSEHATGIKKKCFVRIRFFSGSQPVQTAPLPIREASDGERWESALPRWHVVFHQNKCVLQQNLQHPHG